MNEKIKIIAEIGPNHNGSIKTALKLLDHLAKIGVKIVKFQLADPYKVYSNQSFKASYQKKNTKRGSIIEMSKKIQLKRNDHLLLNKVCKKLNIIYSCSAFDLDSLKFLNEKIDIPFFKIPSGEILSIDMLNYISLQNKPIFLSTGMATLSEIDFALNILNKINKKEITLMHCISSYPASPKNANMNFIETLKKKYKLNIGFSDHTLGHECALIAVSKGANIIEKHVTLNKNSIGPDHKISLNVNQFKNFIKKIYNTQNSLGSKDRYFSKKELEIKNVARKSIVANKDLLKGYKIKLADITFKRPGIGISPDKINLLVNKKLNKNVRKNNLILISDIID